MEPTAIDTIIRDRIARAPACAISWAEVMELALYHPEHGYYGRGPLRIGRGGDFHTSVSVGPLYGRLLAGLADQIWRALGEPGVFSILEQGAHDGQLMEDVARGLEAMGGPLAQAARYCIVEPNDKYRAAQAARLVPMLGSRVKWVADLAALGAEPRHAFFMTNELLDAFPVHRVKWTGCAWVELVVGIAADGALEWRDAPPSDPRVADEIDRLPRNLPPGHTTEVHPASVEWARQLAACAFQGAVLIADYGLDESEYYSAERSDGTLRRYHDHKTDGEVLHRLGECDLTAHINFTRVRHEAKSRFEVARCMDQGRFLTRMAAPWLRSLEGAAPSPDTAALLRQFQTLTHPAHMGDRFRICILCRGIGSAIFPE